MPGFNFTGRPTPVRPINILLNMYDFLVASNTSDINSYDDLRYEKVLMKLKPGKSREETLKLLNRFALDYSYSVFDFEVVKSSFNTINLILNVLLSFIIVVCMVLSLFSLISTMSSNMMEQKKELAVMRCIGLRRFQIIRIFMYEAVAVILTGASIGLAVGCLVGWTIVAQNSLFSNSEFTVVFPWVLILVIFLTSLVSSLLAAGIPAFNMLRQNIVTLIKSIN